MTGGVALALVALGALLDWLGIPPGPLPVAVLVADVPFLLLALHARGWKRWAYLYGFVHFAFALRWMGEVHPAQIVGTGLVLGLVYLLAALALRFLVRRRVPLLLAAPAVLVGEELLRTVWFGGMPWPSRSLSFVAFPSGEALVASSAYLGAYALVFLAALTGAAFLVLVRAIGARQPARAAFAVALPAACFALLVAGGRARLADHERRLEAGEIVVTSDAPLLAVQGNIPQSLKHSDRPGERMAMLNVHLRLTREGMAEAEREGRGVLAVLWPETMIPWEFVDSALAHRFPDVWENELRIVQNVSSTVAGLPDPPPFLLGVVFQFRRGDERHATLGAYGTHDSLLLVHPAKVPSPREAPAAPPPPGTPPPWVGGRHDKTVLVPGGEYTPLGEVLVPLRWFRSLVSVIPELDPGSGDAPPFELVTNRLRHDGDTIVPMGTVICFELLFPSACRSWRARGAQVLLNAANYGWFGPTGFRAQIRAAAALRAAETATTVVVAGNTGPTSFWGPTGRPYGRLRPPPAGTDAPRTPDDDTFREGWSLEPVVLDPRATPYVRWGDAPWFALVVWAFAAALLLARRDRRHGTMAPREPGEPGSEQGENL